VAIWGPNIGPFNNTYSDIVVPKKPETRFKERVRPLLEAIPKSEWVKTQMRSLRGIPDFIGVVNGFAVYLELKTADGEADALQKYRLTKYVRAGAYCAILEPANLEHVLRDINNLSECKKPVAHKQKATYY